MPKKEDRGKISFARCALYGGIAGFAVVVALLAFFSALVTGGRLSQDSMRLVTLISGFVGALAGAMTAIRKYKAKVLATGLAVAFGMFFIMALGSALSSGGGMFGGLTPLLLAADMLGGVAASLLGSRRRVKKHG